MKWLLVPLAFICSAFSFPFMPFKGHALPNVSTLPADTFPRIREPGRWFHDMKNLTTELVRADAQWFAKFFCFLIVVLVLLIGVQFYGK